MAFSLPDLPYSYDALAPYMSAETLQVHHDKHHQTYVDNLNKLVAGTRYEQLPLDEICKAAYTDKNPALINNAGQHWNHSNFWTWMTPGGGGRKLPAELERLVVAFGGFDRLRTDFIAAGLSQFGSGWAWLSLRGGKLEVSRTSNGENPLMLGSKPLLGVDVWEHSYYIDYRNTRHKYLEAWFDNLVKWDEVAAKL